jgi:hypothetical protein
LKLSIQDFVVKNDQIHQLKFASYQKMLLYDLDFLGLEKFCLDYEILYEYIFAEIEFKIYETNYFQQIGDNVIFDVFFFFGMVDFNFWQLTSGWVFLKKKGIT